LRDAGLVLGVVSNFEEWLERLLEELGVRGYFQVSVISGVEGFEKPDPRIFRLAMTRAGVTPGRSVYVGDNPEFDVDPALAVGMFPVLIDRRDRFADAPGARITAMGQLPALLGVA
jgi:HAD superfamily hydrolase (TIGR01549 family)